MQSTGTKTMADANREMFEESREEVMIAQVAVRNATRRWIMYFEPFSERNSQVWKHLVNAERELAEARKIVDG